MSTAMRVHGGVPDGVRDHHNVFGQEKDASPEARLQDARAKVARLTTEQDKLSAQFTKAVAANDGRTDLNELARRRHCVARELADAEEATEQWESVVQQTEKANREHRLHEIVASAQKVKDKLHDAYRDAGLALGEWYDLANEARELVSKLGDHMPGGHVYFRADLKEALTTFDSNPDPRPELLERYRETETFQSWKRQLALIPLVAKEK